MIRILCLFFLLIPLSMAFSAQFYKWYDENGVLHIGDQPPSTSVENTKTIRLQDNTNTPSEPIQLNQERFNEAEQIYYDFETEKNENYNRAIKKFNRALISAEIKKLEKKISALEEKCILPFSARSYIAHEEMCDKGIERLEKKIDALKKNPDLYLSKQKISTGKKRDMIMREEEKMRREEEDEEERKEGRFRNIRNIAPNVYRDQYGDRYRPHGEDGFIDLKTGKIRPKGTYKYTD